MKLLYEPVAVRHAVYFFLPETPQSSGQTIGNFREGEKRNAESKYPDRNAPPQKYAASAGESEEIKQKGEKICKEKQETRCYRVSFV